RDVAAELENDLRVATEGYGTNAPTKAPTVDVRADVSTPACAEADETACVERLPPDDEELAERHMSRAGDLDHTRRLARPHRVRAFPGWHRATRRGARPRGHRPDASSRSRLLARDGHLPVPGSSRCPSTISAAVAMETYGTCGCDQPGAKRGDGRGTDRHGWEP